MADLQKVNTPKVIEIPLTQGKVALVDESDYPLVAGRKWAAAKDEKNWYALGYNRKNKLTERMHIIITGRKGDDHKNGNGLDNRRENLRPATTSQNGGNRRMSCNNKAGFKGVCFIKRVGLWKVKLQVAKTYHFIGYFRTALAAAKAYDAAALQHFGEFAKTNF